MKQLKESLLDNDFDAADPIFDPKRFEKLHNPAAAEWLKNRVYSLNYNILFCNYVDTLRKAAESFRDALKEYGDEERYTNTINGDTSLWIVNNLASNNSINKLDRIIANNSPSPKDVPWVNDMMKFTEDLDDMLNKKVHGYSKMEIDVSDIEYIIKRPGVSSNRRAVAEVLFRDPGKSLNDIKALDGKRINGFTFTYISDPEKVEIFTPFSWRDSNSEVAMLYIE